MKQPQWWELYGTSPPDLPGLELPESSARWGRGISWGTWNRSVPKRRWWQRKRKDPEGPDLSTGMYL